MGHAFASNFVHCVFSTKQRAPLIPLELEPGLCAYLSGVAANLNFQLLAAGGTANHIQLLLYIPPTLSVSEAINKVKSNSSRWLREHGLDFSWQEGYGAFSVGASQLPAVKQYINRQYQHHRKRNFEEEFVSLLRKYGVDYDPQHVFG